MSKTNDGTLSFAAVLDTTAYQRGLRLLEQATRGAASSVTSNFGSIVGSTEAIGNSMGKLAGLVGGYFSFRAVSDLARQIFNVRKEIQSLEISFETLLGSKPKADALFGSIRKFAVETPMQLKDLASAAQLMLSFNIGEDKIMPYLKALGDISMGDTQRFNSLALAFSQMSSAGKLMGQDLMQMINAGFNPLAQMAEKTGKSIAELKEEMSAGKITAEMVQQAFTDATSEGGKYFGMLEKQSKGLAGAYSNLQGAMDDMFNELGEKTQGVMVGAIEVTTSLAKNYEQVGTVVASLVAAYGTYKAATMAVVAAQNLQAIGIGRLTTFEKIHYAWLVLVEKAQKLLNATMLSNPYVLAAAAIAAVVVALMSMKTETEKLKEAQENYNKELNETIEAERKHREEIEKLIDTAEDESKSTEERKKALWALRDAYPEIFAKYKTELEMLKDLKKIKEEIAELDKARSHENPAVELDDVEKRIADLENHKIYVNGKWETVKMDTPELKALYKKRDELKQKVTKDNADNYLANLTGVSNEALQKEIEAREKILKQLGESDGNGKVIGGGASGTFSKDVIASQLATLRAEQNRRNAPTKTADEWTKSYKETYDKAKKAYEDYLKSKDKVSEEEFRTESKRLKAEMEAAEKQWKGYTGQSGKNDAKEAKQAAKDKIKIRDLEKKQAKEEARAAQDLEWQVRQAVIDAMQEGEEKQIQQMQLNHEKEIEEIGRQKEDLLQSKIDAARAIWDADSKNESKAFDSSGIALSQKENDNFSNLISNANAKYANQEAIIAQQRAQSMNEYLRQWGDLQERIQAVRDLRDQALATESDEGKRNAIKAEADQAIAELESNADRSSSAIAKLFSDMSKTSVADLKAIAEAGQEAIDFIEGGEWDEAKGLELGISKETFDYLQKTPEELKKCKDAVAQIKQEASSLGSPLDQVADGLKKLFSAGNNQKKLQQGLTQLQEGVNKIGAAVSVVQNAASELADAFGSEVMGGIADGLSVASDAMSGAMQGAQAGAAFGPWGAAAGAAIGLVGKLGSSLAKLHDAKHEKAIQKIQERIEVLKESYDKLGRSIEKAYSKDASRLIDQQNVMLRQQQALIRKQIAEEKSKKKADQDRIKEWEDQIKEIDQTIADNKEKAIDAIFGEDVKSAISNFADAYASMFEAGNTKAKAAKDVVRSMIKQMVVELMKSDISNFMESFRAKMMEYWTDNIIEDWEERALQNLAEQELGQLSGKYSWADKYFKDLYGQNSTSGGFQAMSQDSADELNGRFTALQMSAVSIDASLAGIALNVEAMRSVADFNRTALDEIRSVSAIALMHLENIDTNTRQLKSMNDRLDKIERNTQRI